MQRTLIILAIVLLTFSFAGCLLTKGHFTKDGSMWIWDKDPGGKFNSHNPLQLDKATNWVDTILQIPALRTIKTESTSGKWDHYDVNDSIMFFNLNNKELPNYHSYHTFANRLKIAPAQLQRIVLDFDKLGLNRFYREEDFIVFNTVTYFDYRKGYFYFIDSSAGKKINPGDTLDFSSNKECKYFRETASSKFLVTKKYNDHWIEWELTLR